MHLRSRGVWKAESVLIHNQDTCRGIYELHKDKVWKHLNGSFWITRTTSEWFICEGKDIESSWLLFVAPAFHSNIPPEVGWRWYTSPYNRKMEDQSTPSLMYVSKGVDIGQNICAFERQCLDMAKYQNVILHGGQGSRMVAIQLIKTFLEADPARIVAFVTATTRQAVHEGDFLNKEYNLGVKVVVLRESSMSWARMSWEKCFAVYRVIVCPTKIYRSLYRTCMTASQFSLIVLYECVESMGPLVKALIRDCTAEEEPRIVALSSQLAHPNADCAKRSKYESLLQAKIIAPEKQKIYFPKTKKFVVGYPDKEPYEEIFRTIENILKQTLESIEITKHRLRQYLTRCFDVLSEVGLLGLEHFITQTVPPLLASYPERKEWTDIIESIISEIKAKIKDEPTGDSEQEISTTGIVLSDHGISIKVAKLITLLKQLFWDSTETSTKGVILVEESDLRNPLVFLINTVIDGLVGLRITAGGCGDSREERDETFAKFESGTISVLVLTQDTLLKLKGISCSFLIQYSAMVLPKFLINQFTPRDRNVPSPIYVFESGVDPEVEQGMSVGEHTEKPCEDQVVILGGMSKPDFEQTNRPFSKCLNPTSDSFVPRSLATSIEPVLSFVCSSAPTYASLYPPPKSPQWKEEKTKSKFNPNAEEFQPSPELVFDQNDTSRNTIRTSHQFSHTPIKVSKQGDIFSQIPNDSATKMVGSSENPNESVMFIHAIRNNTRSANDNLANGRQTEKLKEESSTDAIQECQNDTNIRMEKLYSELTKPVTTPKKVAKFEVTSQLKSIWNDGSKSWCDSDDVFDRFSNHTFKPSCRPMNYNSPKKKVKAVYVENNELPEKVSNDWGVSDTLWGHKKDLLRPNVLNPTNSLPESVDFFSLWTEGSGKRRHSTWSNQRHKKCDSEYNSNAFNEPLEGKVDVVGKFLASTTQLGRRHPEEDHDHPNILDQLGLRSEVSTNPLVNTQSSVKKIPNSRISDKSVDDLCLSSTGNPIKKDEEKDKKTRRRKRAKRRRARKKKRGTVLSEPSNPRGNVALGQKSSTQSISEGASKAADSVWNLWGKPHKLLSPKKNPTMKWSQLCHKDPKSKLNVLVLKIWKRTEVLRYTTRKNHDSMYITELEVKPINRVFTSNSWRTKNHSEQDASHQAYTFLERTKNLRARTAGGI